MPKVDLLPSTELLLPSCKGCLPSRPVPARTCRINCPNWSLDTLQETWLGLLCLRVWFYRLGFQTFPSSRLTPLHPSISVPFVLGPKFPSSTNQPRTSAFHPAPRDHTPGGETACGNHACSYCLEEGSIATNVIPVECSKNDNIITQPRPHSTGVA